MAIPVDFTLLNELNMYTNLTFVELNKFMFRRGIKAKFRFAAH